MTGTSHIAALAGLQLGSSVIDHIGIAVDDLASAIATWRALGFALEFTETVQAQAVAVAMLASSVGRVELLAAFSADSAVGRFLVRRGPGMHHIALAVSDFDARVEALRAAGVRLAGQGIGAGGHRFCFLHPSQAAGVLIELVERA